jgi:hypothetical protein
MARWLVRVTQSTDLMITGSLTDKNVVPYTVVCV